MQPGNLVITRRAQIGIPKGSTGLILESNTVNVYDPVNKTDEWDMNQFVVAIFHSERNLIRRYLERDLELVS